MDLVEQQRHALVGPSAEVVVSSPTARPASGRSQHEARVLEPDVGDLVEALEEHVRRQTRQHTGAGAEHDPAQQVHRELGLIDEHAHARANGGCGTGAAGSDMAGQG